MKFLSIITLLFVNNCLLFCQQNKSYFIKGHFKDLPDSKIYLSNKAEGYGSGFKIIYFDSTISKNGHFSFKGKVAEPDYRSIEIVGKGGWQTFIIENSKIVIEGNADSIWKAKVSGSTEDSMRKKLIYSKGSLIDSLNSTAQQSYKASNKRDTILSNYFSKQNQYYMTEIIATEYEFAKSHPQSFITLFQLNDILKQFGPDTAKKVFHSLSKKLKLHSKTPEIFYKLFSLPENVQLLKKAPVFIQKDTSLKNISLSNYKGKYVLLDFWASWCGPCRAQNPALLSAYEKFKDGKFEILGISLDIELKKWKDAINEDKMPWAQISDLNGNKNKVAILYGIESIPMNFLVDPNGIIVEKNIQSEKLMLTLEKYLGKN